VMWPIINGDKTTGVTIMYLSEGMDAGDIILQTKVDINERMHGELFEDLSHIGADLLLKAINEIELGTAKRIPQGEKYTLAPMITKEMCKIDWQNKTAEEIKNFVRGLNPIPCAYTILNNKKYKIYNVEVESVKQKVKEAGVIIEVTKDSVFIQAKEGIVKILELQAENSKRMKITEFLKGNKLNILDKFE